MNNISEAPVKDIPLSKVWEFYQVMKHRLSRDVFGRDSDWDRELYPEGGLGTLQMIITAILSGGHVLLEDYPGSGKSFLVGKLSQCIHDDI
jgi:MoxR-like ATPase